jgi:hypothetical protein
MTDNLSNTFIPSVLMGDPTETLLNSLRSRGDNSDTGRWLSTLVDNALEIATHGDAEQPITDNDLDTMIRWVGKLFDEFELYRIEFNQKASGTDFIVVASPLSLDNLSSANDSFEAHLSTRYWSLAFDASTRKLNIFLIPAELVLAFTSNKIHDTDYKPFISFVPRRHRDEYYWMVDNQLISFEMLPKLAKELFGDLISVASGNISEQEFFDNSPNGADAAAQSEAAMAATDRSFELETAGVSSESGGTDRLKSADAESSPTSSVANRESAAGKELFALCDNFSTALNREMQSVIGYAGTQPDNVELLLKCKQVLIELEALRAMTVQTSEKLRTI